MVAGPAVAHLDMVAQVIPELADFMELPVDQEGTEHLLRLQEPALKA